MTMRIQSVIETNLLTVRGHGQIMRFINFQLGARHQHSRVRKHFDRNAETNPASGAYGYRARSRRWKAIKEKMGVDPLRPNVVKGDLRTSVLSSSVVRATQYLWSWKAKGSFRMPDWQRRELEAISKGEIADDTETMGRWYQQLADKHPEFKRQRRRKVG